MVTKVEKSNEDEPWLNPKASSNKSVFMQRNSCKMENVQRLSPGQGVKPQVYGGRKIGLLQ